MSEKIEKMFEVATREQLRFPYKGSSSVEDLWSLNVNELDSIFKVLSTQLRQVKEESLLDVKNQQDKELETKIEIIRYIVQVKLEEEKLRLQAKETSQLRQKLLEIKAAKQNASLLEKSIDEIDTMLNDLK